MQTLGTLIGFAARWGRYSNKITDRHNENGGRSFVEVLDPFCLAPGAIRAGLPFRIGHGPDAPVVARINDGLKLKETKRGLKFELDVPDTSFGQRIVTAFRNHTINGFSLSWPASATTSKFTRGTRKYDFRHVTRIEQLSDVCICLDNEPYYPATIERLRFFPAEATSPAATRQDAELLDRRFYATGVRRGMERTRDGFSSRRELLLSSWGGRGTMDFESRSVLRELMAKHDRDCRAAGYKELAVAVR